MEHPLLSAVHATGFQPLGWFSPTASDQFSKSIRFVLLIGNAGPEMFRRFSRERDIQCDSLDNWTRATLTPLAEALGAQVVFPFDLPPLPFQRWGERSGAGHVSPLKLTLHPLYGVWFGYRAALLFPVEFDLPKISAGPNPCLTCTDQPCLSTCPVSAFSLEGYDVMRCAEYVRNVTGNDCAETGCLARRVCPVGQAFVYSSSEAQFYMRTFLGQRRKQASSRPSLMTRSSHVSADQK